MRIVFYLCNLKFHRNRLIELHKYVLPIDSSGKGVMQPLAYSPEEFRYMKENNTVELPPNFPHRVVRLTKEVTTGPALVVNKVKHYRLKNPSNKPRKVRTAKFRNLELRGSLVARDAYPHNILLMKNGSVVFATQYTDSIDLGKATCDPRDIRVIGHEFQSVSWTIFHNWIARTTFLNYLQFCFSFITL